MKYRLVKVIKASGFVLWIIQKKFLWWWEFVDAYAEQEKAEFVLVQLRGGVPPERRIVIPNH